MTQWPSSTTPASLRRASHSFRNPIRPFPEQDARPLERRGEGRVLFRPRVAGGQEQLFAVENRRVPRPVIPAGPKLSRVQVHQVRGAKGGERLVEERGVLEPRHTAAGGLDSHHIVGRRLFPAKGAKRLVVVAQKRRLEQVNGRDMDIDGSPHPLADLGGAAICRCRLKFGRLFRAR